MPLHLLSKKSWNVYNADNVARVRRDEALARAQEEAEEERMREHDALNRLAVLRGEAPLPLPETVGAGRSSPTYDAQNARDDERPGHNHRKRKRHGEDDTDFEIRLAMEKTGSGGDNSAEDQRRPATSSAPIVDKSGHIDLFGQASARPPHEAHRSNTKTGLGPSEKNHAGNERDIHAMRLIDATGRTETPKDDPWYVGPGRRARAAELAQGLDDFNAPDTDAWGRQDPGRKEREKRRISLGDPLATMRSGARQVRELARERRRAAEERERELEELKQDAEASQKRRKRGEGTQRDERGEGGGRMSGDNPGANRKRDRSGDRNRRGHRHGRERERGRERASEDRTKRHTDRGDRGGYGERERRRGKSSHYDDDNVDKR